MNRQQMQEMDVFKLEQIMLQENNPVLKSQMKEVVNNSFMQSAKDRITEVKVRHIEKVKENTKGMFIQYPYTILSEEVMKDNRCYNTMYLFLCQNAIRGKMSGDRGEVYRRYYAKHKILATPAADRYVAGKFGYNIDNDSKSEVRRWKDKLISLGWVKVELIRSENNRPLTVYLLGKKMFDPKDGKYKDYYLSENPDLKLR